MKEFFKQKAIQLKSWIDKGTMVDNKLSIKKTFATGSAIYDLWCFTKFLLTLCLNLLVTLDKALPYAIHFFEAFISTLSYQNKKEFFMDFPASKLFRISNNKYVAELLNVEKEKLKNVSSDFVPYKFEQSIKGKKRILYNPNDIHKAILKK